MPGSSGRYYRFSRSFVRFHGTIPSIVILQCSIDVCPLHHKTSRYPYPSMFYRCLHIKPDSELSMTDIVEFEKTLIKSDSALLRCTCKIE